LLTAVIGADLQQRTQCVALPSGEAAVDLPLHMALGLQQGSRYQGSMTLGPGTAMTRAAATGRERYALVVASHRQKPLPSRAGPAG